MRTFLAIGRKSGLRIVFKYDLNGVLRSVEFDGIWTDELIERIKVKIPANVQYCISEIKNQVAELSLAIAEKVVRGELSDKAKQTKLVEDMLKEVTL